MFPSLIDFLSGGLVQAGWGAMLPMRRACHGTKADRIATASAGVASLTRSHSPVA